MFTTQNTLDNQKEMNIFVEMLSPSLKAMVMRHTFISTFNVNSMFDGESELINFYIKDIVPYMR